MKNPLRKRLPREFRDELGKYLVILILLVATIGFVSGFLVADGSMLSAYNEGFTKYCIENGHFTTVKQMNKAQKKAIEDMGINIYEQFYVEEELENNSKLRIYADRTQVNTVCLMEGSMPAGENEIALDRMYADNNSLTMGESINIAGKTYVVTGLVALPDYSCLFEDNGDSMFDAVKFGVAVVTPEAFHNLDKEQMSCTYAWRYKTQPTDEIEEKEWADDLSEQITQEVVLDDYVPRYMNQAIRFTGDDMGSDKAMVTVLLYIIIIIMAFVFGLTISDTITRESNVIGTLRASGYTKKELISHYMAAPMAITLLGAVAGNIIGYTIMKKVCVDMYYGSYSLPTYTTVWSGEAFVLTTIIPAIMMAVINYAVLSHKMKCTPLQFLRKDLTKRKRKHAVKLSRRIPFFLRFRLRVIFQNIGNYVVLMIGILFVNLLLLFGLGMPSTLDYYQNTVTENMLAKYQYILTIPTGSIKEDHKLESMLAGLEFMKEVSTENEDAEKFSAYSLETTTTGVKKEEILFYGIEENSKYVDLDLKKGDVVISSAYAGKFDLEKGDIITLKEKYEKEEYSFQVTGIYDYEASLVVFMDREYLNEVFDLGKGMFGGYFSSTEITDIDSQYIGSVIDEDALTKISRQLDVSMGNFMVLIEGFAVLIFVVIIYLLSKIIIEKNASAISMTKILGYRNGEIGRLYILSTTMVVILGILISIPLDVEALKGIWKEMMLSSFTGWLPCHLESDIYIKTFTIGIISYACVAFLELRKIKRVPMDVALKNVE